MWNLKNCKMKTLWKTCLHFCILPHQKEKVLLPSTGDISMNHLGKGKKCFNCIGVLLKKD